MQLTSTSTTTSIAPPAVDMGESPPTRSIRGRSASSSNSCVTASHDQAAADGQESLDDSIDTTNSPKRFNMPYFSIRRFLRGPNQQQDNNNDISSSASSSGNVKVVPPMSEPSSSSNDNDNNNNNDDGEDVDNRSDVPSLSSLEAGEYYNEREDGMMMESIPLEAPSVVPMNLEERARYFFGSSYPTSHFDPPTSTCNGDEKDDRTEDSECDSNSSSSSLESTELAAATANYQHHHNHHHHHAQQRRRSSHAILDRSNILFPPTTISKSRDQHSCTTYMFSVFVGCVALVVLIVGKCEPQEMHCRLQNFHEVIPGHSSLGMRYSGPMVTLH